MFLFSKNHISEAKYYLELAKNADPGDKHISELLYKIDLINNNQPTISCCMIVKNEEDFLEKCLQSIRNHVDEIIIVDTGSTDNSVEIARRYTEKVYFHDWEHDFSKARNQSLSYATKDWIFIIDGDEELIEGSGENIRKTVSNAGGTDAFLVNTVSIFSKGRKKARHNSERLFRNNRIIKYEGIVHNKVVGFTCLKASKIEIMHYGYDLEEKKANAKFLRTTGLLKKQIAENPEDPTPHHYLGTSYITNNMFEECVKESLLALELAKKQGASHPMFLWTRFNAAMAYYHLGNLDKAKTLCLEAINIDPRHLDSYHALTLISAEEGNWQDVIKFGGHYLNLVAFYDKNPDLSGVLINCTLKEESGINLLMGHAFYSQGNSTTMRYHYDKSCSCSERKWEALYNIGYFTSTVLGI